MVLTTNRLTGTLTASPTPPIPPSTTTLFTCLTLASVSPPTVSSSPMAPSFPTRRAQDGTSGRSPRSLEPTSLLTMLSVVAALTALVTILVSWSTVSKTDPTTGAPRALWPLWLVLSLVSRSTSSVISRPSRSTIALHRTVSFYIPPDQRDMMLIISKTHWPSRKLRVSSTTVLNLELSRSTAVSSWRSKTGLTVSTSLSGRETRDRSSALAMLHTLLRPSTSSPSTKSLLLPTATPRAQATESKEGVEENIVAGQCNMRTIIIDVSYLPVLHSTWL